MHKNIPIKEQTSPVPSDKATTTSHLRNRIYVSLLFTGMLLFSAIFRGNGQSPAIDNPVLPGVADAGVIKFNGEYYIGGVFTNGGFYISSDLVHWEGPVHVFSMDNAWTEGASAKDSQIHASDINYINGLFHLYWSVNYWGEDDHVVHIGHATSPHILGPYREPVKDTWLADRIDPHLFMDDDGKKYLYMVKFTDGNTIWTRPMKDPGTFSGEPRYIFSSLPDTWETMDNRVAEGAWVIKYRDRYYMMYNTNHTSTRWGNYALGVAEAGSPQAFNHGSKYPYPVVKSNQIELEDTFVDVLQYSGEQPGIFHYTLERPGKGWTGETYHETGWQKGKLGFGSQIIENSTARDVKTLWKSQEIWVRKTFTVDEKDTGNYMLRMHHDGETTVFLNGRQIYKEESEQYLAWDFDRQAPSLLRPGTNTLAIHSTRGVRSAFLDVSLFYLRDSQGDDILYSPGQPNILRGPNGFEWWLIYMANKNAERRGQFINRVHFFNKRLVVDGITGIHTPGYHPPPAAPTIGALFNEGDLRGWTSHWELSGGTWEPAGGELVQANPSFARALVKHQPAAHYLFEAGIKIGDTETGGAGIYAWWQDEANWLKIVLDQEKGKWVYVLQEDGKAGTFSFALPDDFNFNVYHTLQVQKNAGQFTVKIDGLPAPEKPVIKAAGLSGEGRPGLFTEGANTAFDGILYTIGWDEFDATITGWGPSAKEHYQSGSWQVTGNGISPKVAAGENSIFKGDMLEEYEISLQVTVLDAKGRTGIYPVYTDARNYIKVALDPHDHALIISGKRNGKPIVSRNISLESSQSYYADMRYTDFIAKRFTLHAPAYISRIKFNKTPHNRPDTLIEDIYKKVAIFYRQQGQWHPLTEYTETSSHPGYEEISFQPVKAGALKFVNKRAEDHHFYMYRIGVNSIFKESYHLRVAKRKDGLVFLVDGKEVFRMKNDFPASQVGLFTENSQAVFNGITLFHLNTQAGR